MDNLSDRMKERLEKWRKRSPPAPSVHKSIDRNLSRRSGKNDYGDAMTLEEWNEEAKKSQTRR